ncbi:MAG: amidohydrolase [Gemmatimonadaceae bacterium]|nr:amidohydrolase [Gemmatimonadaceae bacterium]
MPRTRPSLVHAPSVAPLVAPLAALLLAFPIFTAPLAAQVADAPALHATIDRRTAELEAKVVAWRRDIHQHPELSFQEVRTAKLVADHLRALGLEVSTGVGGHGVVGLLKGGKPGPVVALRADMDALPVTEVVDLPFKSAVRAVYNGQETGVMHACGHDNHVAILMGTAELLAGMKASLPGTVKFIFQPAEEGPPVGGAGPMIEAGVLENPKVDAIFGLHVGPGPLGTVGWRGGATAAAADQFRIVVRGKQTHGAYPSAGIDPIVIGSQIVLGLQTIISRQSNLITAPAVLTVGAFHAGLRENIIPDSAWMIGTVRTLDAGMRTDILDRLKRTAESIAQSAGASAEVHIERGYPVTMNDAPLALRMMPSLQRVVGAAQLFESQPGTAGEDFSRYAEKVPGFFFGLGVAPKGSDPRTVAPNHSPLFVADEAALPIGVRLMASVAVDYLIGETRVQP